MRTIIVTGATGTIGRAVIKILSQHDGVAIRAATRNPEKVRAGVGAEQLTPIVFDWDAPHTAGDVTASGFVQRSLDRAGDSVKGVVVHAE